MKPSADESAILTQAAQHFGKESQMRALQEECAELIVAVNHHLRGKIPVIALYDELADVQIMLDQMGSFFHAPHIEAIRQSKIRRLADRIRDERPRRD